MTWMNEHEIDASHERLRERAAGRYATFLRDFKDVVNANSDGWQYWKPASAAAKGLSALIGAAIARERGVDRSEPPTEEVYAKALRPIRAFLTRKGLGTVTLGPPLD